MCRIEHFLVTEVTECTSAAIGFENTFPKRALMKPYPYRGRHVAPTRKIYLLLLDAGSLASELKSVNVLCVVNGDREC